MRERRKSSQAGNGNPSWVIVVNQMGGVGRKENPSLLIRNMAFVKRTFLPLFRFSS